MAGQGAFFVRRQRLAVQAARRYSHVMSMTLQQIEHEALQLSPSSRADLAERLVSSLDSAELDEIQKRWGVEAIRRRDEVRSGKVVPIPGADVTSEVRRSVGR